MGGGDSNGVLFTGGAPLIGNGAPIQGNNGYAQKVNQWGDPYGWAKQTQQGGNGYAQKTNQWGDKYGWAKQGQQGDSGLQSPPQAFSEHKDFEMKDVLTRILFGA